MKKESGGAAHGASHDGSRGASRPEKIMRAAGVILWIGLIGIFLLNRDRITVESILEKTPRNPWEAVPLMLVFFGIKGMSMVMYAGILYTVSGLLFPLPLAVAVNLLGTAVMVTVPWLCGRFVGGDAAARFDAKYPAAARLAAFREKNDWLFSLGVRTFGGLPSDPLSLYLGAVKLDWPALVFGGVVGYLPKAVTLPLMAQHADDPSSPVFVISSVVAGLFACAPAIFLLVLRIRKIVEKRKEKTGK